MSHIISTQQFVSPQKLNPLSRLLLNLLDRMLGLAEMQRIYQSNNMQGLDKAVFARKLLEVMEIDVQGIDEVQAAIPKEGPLLLCSNHPFGGLEGVILALVLSEVRPDLKVMANVGLKVFPELQDYFIFINPLSERDPANGPALRQSMQHVNKGGALLIFPAGRVSYYRPELKRVSDHDWNRIIGRIIKGAQATYLPLFVAGKNSNLFYNLGRIYYRLRLFMLGWELLNKRGASIGIHAGTAIPAKRFAKDVNHQERADLCRLLTYCQEPEWRGTWAQDTESTFANIAPEIAPEVLREELAGLPEGQHLFSFRDFDVYYGAKAQMPHTVNEIARLREIVFREHNEGSGASIDTDQFDATYTHLFVVKRDTDQVIGAYRMGQTDVLLQNGGVEQLYLSQMFNFKPEFINRQGPCLELGRSFVIPEFQRHPHSLYLLWRGIGAFLVKYPQYRHLYGTVSLSKLYDHRSIATMENALVTPTTDVVPHNPYQFDIHPEMRGFAKEHSLHKHLSTLLAGMESDGKDIPVLLKHYMKMNAKFHCLGVDGNFAETPGLLLSVHMPDAPEKQAKQYMAEGFDSYMSYVS